MSTATDSNDMILRFRPTILFASMLIVISTASVVHAQSTTLAWNASADPTVTGYRLSYGTRTGTYNQTVNVGNVTQYTVTGLDLTLDYFFAVQAYTGSELVSGFSNEAMRPAPVPPGTTTISSFTANSGYPLLVGNPVTWTVTASSIRGPVEYRFAKYSPQAGWIVAQNFTQNPNFTWTPSWDDVGSNHSVQAWVRSVGSTFPYEAWIGTNPFDVVQTPVQLTADVDFPTPPDNPVHWTATVAGASSVALEYKFVVRNVGTGVWTVLREYATSNQLTWTPSTTGTYMLQVWVRRVGTTVAYDAWAGTNNLSVARTAPTVTLSADKTFPTTTGTTITWTARPRGGNTGPLQYQFARYSAATGWSIVRPYSTSNTFSWTSAWGEDGQYMFQVWLRNGGSTAPYDAWVGTPLLDIQPAPLHVAVGSSFPVPPGTAVTITGQVADSSATFEYQFYLYDRGTGTWSLVRDYTTNNSFTWIPSVTGTYLFQVWGRRVGSTATYDVWGSTDYLDVAVGPAQVTAIDANTALPVRVGTAITWTATAQGGTASPLQYMFFRYSEGVGWSVLRGWSTQRTVTWTPTAADVGNHLVQVWVRSAGSTADYEGYLGTPYFIIQP